MSVASCMLGKCGGGTVLSAYSVFYWKNNGSGHVKILVIDETAVDLFGNEQLW